MAGVDPRLRSAYDLIMQGRHEQARALLQRHLKNTPGDATANNLMGLSYAGSGEFERAVYFGRRATDAAPDDPNFATNLANSLVLTARSEEAVEILERHAAIDPSHFGVAATLPEALIGARRPMRAVEAARAALDRFGPSPDLSASLASALVNTCRADEAIRVLGAAVREHPEELLMHHRLAASMNYVWGLDPEEAAEAHREFGRRMGAAVRRTPVAAPPVSGRIRLGMVSPDLRRHSVARFVEPLLRHLDRGLFEVICYSTVHVEDEVSDRLRSHADGWRRLSGLPPDVQAARIRADRLHILLDLAGHTSLAHLALLQSGPASLVVSAVGYPNTTGLGTVSARLVDSLTDTPGADPLHTERLVRLDPCFLCFEPPEREQPYGPVPDGPPTFGCFNAAPKINARLIGLWSRVLARVPGSRLILKAGGLDEPALQDSISKSFESHGVDRSRLEFCGWLRTDAEHRAVYQRVGVGLDSFPYHGTTTTCEALWMGVPVVSLVGRVHASRVGLSLLTAVGLPELCARDEDSYVDTAAALALDRPRLTDLRASLRARLGGSTLCDGAAHARRFAGAMRALLQGAPGA